MVLLGKRSFEKACDGVFSRKVVLRQVSTGYLKNCVYLVFTEAGEVQHFSNANNLWFVHQAIKYIKEVIYEKNSIF